MLIAKTCTVCDVMYASPSLHGQKRCKFQLNCHTYFYRRQFLHTHTHTHTHICIYIYIYIYIYISKCCDNDDDQTYPMDTFAILFEASMRTRYIVLTDVLL